MERIEPGRATVASRHEREGILTGTAAQDATMGQPERRFPTSDRPGAWRGTRMLSARNDPFHSVRSASIRFPKRINAEFRESRVTSGVVRCMLRLFGGADGIRRDHRLVGWLG